MLIVYTRQGYEVPSEMCVGGEEFRKIMREVKCLRCDTGFLKGKERCACEIKRTLKDYKTS